MCISPVTLNQNGKLQTFECGRCFECVRKRKLHWMIRLHGQMSVSDVAFFSLISYNEENYPCPDNYEKEEIQKLVKRLRSRLKRNFSFMKSDVNKPIKLSYFIVSEYGEEKNRLHYHALFFLENVNPNDCTRVFWKSFLEETWSRGFCSAFPLDHKQIVYTCKYMQKSYNMLLHSQSLGKEAYFSVAPEKLNYDELDTYVVNGKHHVVPRSWRDQLRKGSHNSVAARAISNKLENQQSKLTLRDRITLNNSYLRDNPIENKPYERQDNSDIQPSKDFD